MFSSSKLQMFQLLIYQPLKCFQTPTNVFADSTGLLATLLNVRPYISLGEFPTEEAIPWEKHVSREDSETPQPRLYVKSEPMQSSLPVTQTAWRRRLKSPRLKQDTGSSNSLCLPGSGKAVPPPSAAPPLRWHRAALGRNAPAPRTDRAGLYPTRCQPTHHHVSFQPSNCLS